MNGSDWSGCVQFDQAELETDFSDMENEYMEIRPDPSDPADPGDPARNSGKTQRENDYSSIY